MLSEPNVKQGYNAAQTIGVRVVSGFKGCMLKPCKQAETFSTHTVIRDRFVNENALFELEDLMNQVLARRMESNSSMP